jgi:hypothetical protein
MGPVRPFCSCELFNSPQHTQANAHQKAMCSFSNSTFNATEAAHGECWMGCRRYARFHYYVQCNRQEDTEGRRLYNLVCPEHACARGVQTISHASQTDNRTGA